MLMYFGVICSQSMTIFWWEILSFVSMVLVHKVRAVYYI